MKKKFIFISFMLVFAMLLSITPTARVRAEDNSWKLYLADFLINNFPSLFDEATKEKNNETIKKYDKDINYQGKGWGVLTPLSDYFSIDVKESGELLIPWRYNCYDLDSDGKPEVIIDYGGIASGMGWREVYKLYGTSYEIIGTLRGGENYERLYVNPQNKIVSINPDSTRTFEINNREIIYIEYVDSTGSGTYHGIKYSEIGSYSEYFMFKNEEEWLNREVFLADLRRIPQFDCSEVIESLKYMPVAPRTGNTSIFIFIVLGLMSVTLFYIKSSKVKINRKNRLIVDVDS